MKWNRFQAVSGTFVEPIPGQSRIGYSMSDTADFYDMVEWSKKGGFRGSTLSFYDYDNGRVYQPFAKQRNVLYGVPAYLQGLFWFLQGDYNERTITLFSYLPGEVPTPVTQLSTEEVNPYRLKIIGEEVHIISEDDEVVCYYPESFRFSKSPQESALLIWQGKVYCSAWVEEGWDEEHDCATDEYRYYERIVVRDFEGNILWEELGSLNRGADGSWWIS